jgi:hypothetical protein
MAAELIVSYLSDPNITEFDVLQTFPDFCVDTNISAAFAGVLVLAPPVWLSTVTKNHPLLYYLVEHGADLSLAPESIDVVDEELDTNPYIYYASSMSIIMRLPWLLDCVYQLGVKPTVQDLQQLVRQFIQNRLETLLVMIAYDTELVISSLVQVPVTRLSVGHRSIITTDFWLLPIEAFMIDLEFGIGCKIEGCTASNEQAVGVLKYYGSRPSEERLEATRRFKRSRE